MFYFECFSMKDIDQCPIETSLSTDPIHVALINHLLGRLGLDRPCGLMSYDNEHTPFEPCSIQENRATRLESRTRSLGSTSLRLLSLAICKVMDVGICIKLKAIFINYAQHSCPCVYIRFSSMIDDNVRILRTREDFNCPSFLENTWVLPSVETTFCYHIYISANLQILNFCTCPKHLKPTKNQTIQSLSKIVKWVCKWSLGQNRSMIWWRFQVMCQLVHSATHKSLGN